LLCPATCASGKKGKSEYLKCAIILSVGIESEIPEPATNAKSGIKPNLLINVLASV